MGRQGVESLRENVRNRPRPLPPKSAPALAFLLGNSTLSLHPSPKYPSSPQSYPAACQGGRCGRVVPAGVQLSLQLFDLSLLRLVLILLVLVLLLRLRYTKKTKVQIGNIYLLTRLFQGVRQINNKQNYINFYAIFFVPEIFLIDKKNR